MPGQFLELTGPSSPQSCTSPCCSQRNSPARDTSLPIPLLDLLSISLILHHTAPYLPVSALFALARTNSRFQNLLLSSPETFRHLDLSTCTSANAAADIAPIDIGGNAWSAHGRRVLLWSFAGNIQPPSVATQQQHPCYCIDLDTRWSYRSSGSGERNCGGRSVQCADTIDKRGQASE